MVSSNKKYILFNVSGQTWAMPLRLGSSFANCENVVKIPGVDPNIVGISYQNGKIITVLDTVKIIGSQASYQDAENVSLLFDYEVDTYALLIDKGLETISPPRMQTDKSNKIFDKYFTYKNNKVFILEPEKIWQVVKIYGRQ